MHILIDAQMRSGSYIEIYDAQINQCTTKTEQCKGLQSCVISELMHSSIIEHAKKNYENYDE